MIVWEQWKVPRKRQWGLQKLGVDKDLARLTVYCGDRYYWGATKICVVRAISKDVLAKVEIINCLDYYNERHALIKNKSLSNKINISFIFENNHSFFQYT